MKRFAILMALFLAVSMILCAMEPVFEDLSEAQRYDLAHAYNMVADKFEELDDAQRAQGYRQMTEVIYPGYGKASRPVETVEPQRPSRPEKQPPDPSGGDASFYYFNKILRGIFNENTSLTISVMADVLYLPLFDEGIDKETVASELDWFFSEYDMTGMAPYDVFIMETIAVTPLENGYWRLDVQTQPGFDMAVPEVTFWAKQMGFYFRKFPEGWRLAAIGPTS